MTLEPDKTGFQPRLLILTQMTLHKLLKSSELRFPFYEAEMQST